MNYKPQGYLNLSNSGGITVMLNESFDRVYYQYTDEETVRDSQLEWSSPPTEEDPQAFFKTELGIVYWLSEFIKIDLKY